MNLRLRTFLIVAIAILLFTGALYGASVFLINDRVQAIENIQIAQNINAVESSLRTELDRMTSTAGDWGTWTDTYNFIQDLNPDYVEANLSNSSLVVLDVHDIVYLDTAGKSGHPKVSTWFHNLMIHYPIILQMLSKQILVYGKPVAKVIRALLIFQRGNTFLLPNPS